MYFLDIIGHYPGLRDNGQQGLSGFISYPGPVLYCLYGFLNHAGCVVGSFRALSCQTADFVCNHCKSFSCFSGPGSFNSRVQRQYVCLECNILNGLNYFSYFAGGLVDVFHGPYHLLHLCLALIHAETVFLCLGAGACGLLGGIAHMGRYLIDSGGQFFYGAGLLGGSLG